MTILDQIIQEKRKEIAEKKKRYPLSYLREGAGFRRKAVSMCQALAGSETGIIAEFKRKSPSKGFIQKDAIATEVVKGYEAAGATACSVVTDATFFGGSLADLEKVRQATDIPLLRKDFILDPYQIAESKSAGADAILLIAAALTPGQCKEYAEEAQTLGLEVLLEIHTTQELTYICDSVDMIGINNRNLKTFVTDIYTSFELGKRIPGCYVKVAESGISSLKTVKALREVGFKGFLIGETFMRECFPGQALLKFLRNVD